MLGTLRSQNGIRRLQEVGDRASFAHEFRVVADGEIDTGLFPTSAFDGRNHQRFGRPGEDGAAQHNRVERSLLLESCADFARNVFDVAQIQFAALQAGCAHADEGDVRAQNCGNRVRGCVQTAALVGFSDQFFHSGLNDRAAAGIEHFDLALADIHAGDFVAHVGETGCAHRTHIAKAEKAD